MQLATFKYDDCELVFEVRNLLTGGESSIVYDGGNFVDNLFYGSEGWMSLDLRGFQIYKGEGRELVQEMKYTEPTEWDTLPHRRNFLHAVRTRNYRDLTCNIDQGRQSAALSLMANICYRTGRKLLFDPTTELFIGDDKANQLLSRRYREPFVMPDKV